MAKNKSALQSGQIGQMAPDFVLKDQYGQDFKLSALKGKRVLLSFYPLAWILECAKQMQALEANTDTFESLNTVSVGISVDSVLTNKAWASTLGIKTLRLLSDFYPHGLVSQEYEVFRDILGFSERANIIVDENRKIIFFKKYESSQFPDIQEIIEALKAFQFLKPAVKNGPT